MLDWDCGSSRNCPGKNAKCKYAVCHRWSVSSISWRGVSPELSGEKDWRIWGRGGRAPDLKATSTSGEDTTQICGLSDTGSVGDISGSAEDETRQFKTEIDASQKNQAAYYNLDRYKKCICYMATTRDKDILRLKKRAREAESNNRRRKGGRSSKATTKIAAAKITTTEAPTEIALE